MTCCTQHDKDATLEDNWFTTGDVATIDHYGHFQITDRSKDVIKSGGEWVSSIEVEGVMMSHPAVCPTCCESCRVVCHLSWAWLHRTAH